jgi:SPP1 gp7 family putative phage head morphogenesis protein
VFNEDGFKRKFSEFKAKALEINENYNINWLKTEQNAAFRISQSAESWQQFEQEKGIFPLLMYQTVKDNRVRQEHARWDGIIRPVNNPFWNDRMPPNDFGCRCIVIQLREGKVSDLRGVPKNKSKVFSNNPGKTGVIFPKTGIPYKIPNEYKKAASENFGLVTPSDKEVRDMMNKIK